MALRLSRNGLFAFHTEPLNITGTPFDFDKRRAVLQALRFPPPSVHNFNLHHGPA
jgi:hypothetical protein